ncbi:MAG: flagellar protein FlaG [Rhodocyclales bacterium]|nr:flagellar protein FlaG [Rhodocyclales bacterium]
MNVPISSVSLPQGGASAVITEPPRAPMAVAPNAAADAAGAAPAVEAGASAAAAAAAPVDREALQGAVERVQQTVEKLSSAGIQFTIDQDFERMVVRVIDTSTKEVIRQIPSKEMLEIAQALDKLQGLLVHQKA